MQNTTTKKSKNIMNMFSGKQILIPIAALLLLAVFNLIADPSFYKISMDVNSAGNHVLSGYLITILDYGSELAILAIGMTLVTAASGGQDISVGAGIAIAGSVILRVLCGTNSRPDKLQAPIIVAFLVACVVSMLFGAFNGILVAGFKIQPMVATLILYTAGRSIAAWINNNELPSSVIRHLHTLEDLFRESRFRHHFSLRCMYDRDRTGHEIYKSQIIHTGGWNQ